MSNMTHSEQVLVIYHRRHGDDKLGELTLRSARFELVCEDVTTRSLKSALDLLEHPLDGHQEILLGKVLSNELFLWTDFRDVRLKLLAAELAELFEISLSEEEARSLARGLRASVR